MTTGKNHLLKRIYIKFLNLVYIKIFKKNVINTPPVILEKDGELIISMLSCHKNLHESIACLKSFYRFLDIKYPLHYFDDGSLSEKDASILRAHFININIFSSSEADKKVNEFLKDKNYTQCLKLRNEKRLYTRLFDFHYFAEDKKIIQLDSDILFFQHPTKLLAAVNNGTPVYNLDRGPAYAYPNNNMEQYIGNHMPYHFNAGLVYFNSNLPDICSFIEGFLETNPQSSSDWVIDQTLLAMYLKTKNCQPLPRTYDLAYHYVIDTNKNDFGNTVSQHYCAWARNMHKVDFLSKVYPFFVEKNDVNKHYFDIISGKLIP